MTEQAKQAEPEFTGDEEHDQAELRRAFPAWRIARVGGRWWASRGLVNESMAGAVQAGTAASLYAALTSRARPSR